ncbi:MAG: NAD(P)-dependent oxidoreductase [Dehalococcoidia bacterium]
MNKKKEANMPGEIKNVLVTGSSGLIGSMLIRSLGDKYTFSGLDISKPSGAPDIPTTVTDAASLEDILPAFDGVDAVIHLAANPAVDTPWEDVLHNNISLTHNVYEACRRQGVRRVVFASSNHAVGLFENDEPYRRIVKGDYSGIDPDNIPQVDHKVPIRPDSDYGISKAFGEATGRYYSEEFGVEAACLRIGTVNRHNDPTQSVRHFATWCSHRDLAQLVDRCLSVDLKFDIFYGVSANKWRFWDISHAANVLGYQPADNAETYR